MVVQETRANLTMWNPLKDLIIRVCTLNLAGCGPWSEPLLVTAQDLIGELQIQWGLTLFLHKENGSFPVRTAHELRNGDSWYHCMFLSLCFPVHTAAFVAWLTEGDRSQTSSSRTKNKSFSAVNMIYARDVALNWTWQAKRKCNTTPLCHCTFF